MATATDIQHGVPMMATATEIKNGVQAAANESNQATVKVFDALSDFYMSAFDAGLKTQTRMVEVGKMFLDEAAASQRSNRQVTAELIKSAGKTQQAIIDATGNLVETYSAPWLPSAKR